jgi:hypothetical protein
VTVLHAENLAICNLQYLAAAAWLDGRYHPIHSRAWRPIIFRRHRLSPGAMMCIADQPVTATVNAAL